MKHESNFVTERVVFGLFSLLFILSAAQVAAIINIDSQPAQTVKAGGTLIPSYNEYSNCVSFVSHKYNKISSNPFDVPASSGGVDTDYSYEVYFDVKNNCERPVSIIDPATLSTTYKNQPAYFSISSFALEQNTAAGPVNVPLEPGATNIINSVMEEGSCVSCELSAMVFRASPLGTVTQGGVSGVRAYEIPVGQTRTFAFTFDIGRPYPTNGFVMFLRAKLKSFKWTYANSYVSGGVVSADEIYTRVLTQTQQDVVATDYVNIYQDANMNSCPSGSSLGFNSSGVVVCQ